MPRPLYPYKIRVQFPAAYGTALQRLSERDHVPITELIRRFTGDGLRASGIDMSPAPIEGQTSIDDQKDDDE